MPFELEIKPLHASLTADEFKSYMSDQKKLSDDSYLMTHHAGVPWLVARLKTDENGFSYASFNISWGHYRFALVWADAFELALNLADAMGAKVIEDTGKAEVRKSNIDKMLDVKGEYLNRHIKIWRDFQKELDQTNKAPLEYPIGEIDAVGEYFALNWKPVKPIALPNLFEKLKLKTHQVAENMYWVIDVVKDEPRLKLIANREGAIQIRPFYWTAPFTVTAGAVLNLGESMRNVAGGELFFFDNVYDKSMQSQLREKSEGLGADFYQWYSNLRHAD